MIRVESSAFLSNGMCYHTNANQQTCRSPPKGFQANTELASLVKHALVEELQGMLQVYYVKMPNVGCAIDVLIFAM